MSRNSRSDDDLSRRQLCDAIVTRAAEMMQSEVKAPHGMIIDRLATYTVAQMVADVGPRRAAELLRSIAKSVEAGAFDAAMAGGNSVRPLN